MASGADRSPTLYKKIAVSRPAVVLLSLGRLGLQWLKLGAVDQGKGEL